MEGPSANSALVQVQSVGGSNAITMFVSFADKNLSGDSGHVVVK